MDQSTTSERGPAFPFPEAILHHPEGEKTLPFGRQTGRMRCVFKRSGGVVQTVRKRLAIVTVCIGLAVTGGMAGIASAWAQSTPPQPGEAQAVVQQIHDLAYGRCMSE